MIYPLSTVALGPLLLTQGYVVRRRIVKLPEPPGVRAGITGSGLELRLLITGDSAAAGVGADHQDDALLGHTIAGLSDAFQVHWRLEATTGHRTADTLTCLRKLEAQRFDVVVTSLGVNDVTTGRTLSTFRLQQRELRALLRDRFGASLLIISGLPPMHLFPALPQPLRWYLGRRAREFDRVLRDDAGVEAGSHWIGHDLTPVPGVVASDGFHPGPATYQEWGRRVAAVVRGDRSTRAGD